jgi:hypothetical protein
MILLEDTRQQEGKHKNIHKYCKDNCIAIESATLLVGDYQIKGCENVAVDTKQSVLELARDLVLDEKLYWRKYRKGYENGVSLYIVIEDGSINNTNDLIFWANPRLKKARGQVISGKTLLEKVDIVRRCYGVNFIFCDKENTGELVITILRRFSGLR